MKTDEYGFSATTYRQAMRSWARAWRGITPSAAHPAECLRRAKACRDRALKLEVA